MPAKSHPLNFKQPMSTPAAAIDASIASSPVIVRASPAVGVAVTFAVIVVVMGGVLGLRLLEAKMCATAAEAAAEAGASKRWSSHRQRRGLFEKSMRVVPLGWRLLTKLLPHRLLLSSHGYS